ncbi:MAG TPA: hypothetical protein VK625_01555 [Flavitalea sp.]|nr:hypothetical protein [Flavitalea sp.]
MTKDKRTFRDVVEDITDVMEKKLTSVDVYILKCHLLAERTLIQYIEDRCGKPIKKFPFNMLRRIAVELYGCLDDVEYDGLVINGADGKLLLKFVDELTELRNQIAHNLTYDGKTMKNAMKLAAEITFQKPLKKPKVKMFDVALAMLSVSLLLVKQYELVK